MNTLINLQDYYTNIGNCNNYIFENCFIDKDYFVPSSIPFNFDYIYNVVYIYKGVKLEGYLRGQKQIEKDKNGNYIDGNIWGFYPNAQNDVIWNNFDAYQSIKKEILSKCYMDDKTKFRHSHLGTNALSKALIQLIDNL